MKLTILTSLLLTLLIAQGCDFEMSTGGDKGDPIPNSTYDSKGLGSDHVTMKINGKPSTDNTFTFGDVVKFDFNNVTGLNRIKGLTYPGMSILITDTRNDSTMYFENDLLSEFDSGTDLTPLLLDATFKTNLPHLNNEKYNIEIKIWDNKGSGKITFNLPFQIKASDVLSIQKEELSFSNIYFWDETDKKVVQDEHVQSSNEFIVICEGLEGFDVVDGMVYPAIKLLMTNKNGEEFFSQENMLSVISETGIEPTKLKEEQVPVTLTFSAGINPEPCHVVMKIFDLKNPDKKIIIAADLVIH